MQFSIPFLAILATASGSVIMQRDLHTSLYYVDVTPAQNFQVEKQVTESINRDVVICNSPSKHLGGNEVTDFCKTAGADRGQI
ncbi:hypothetical protein BDZ45DRAFT_735311 [Acephala macrosclerotiorum]|nr:hypothetical protein BDZ45DRAFT_735311 [Acephala macrosclerotiorum]